MNRMPAHPLTLIFLLGIATVNVQALDKLPTTGCQRHSNLTLLRTCDPYQTFFLHVKASDLGTDAARPHRKMLPKRGEMHKVEGITRRLSLSHLVQRYIEFKEKALNEEEVGRNRIAGASVATKHGTAGDGNESSKWKSPEPASDEGKDSKETNRSVPVPGIATKSIETPLEVNASRETGKDNPPTVPKSKPVCMECASKGFLRADKTSFLLPGYPITREWFEILERRIEPKKPFRYKVRTGDSFIALARRYDTTVYDLKKINRLGKDHLLKVGETLRIVPGRKSPPEEIELEILRAKSGRYKVQKGDTLIGLSKRFGVKSSEIRRINRWKKNRHLRLGETIWIPVSQRKIDAVMKRRKYAFKYVNGKGFRHSLRVVATAYTSHRGQTDRTPFIAAWNNRIRPGMKIIAVSPDLIRKYGITNGTRVKISGLPGIYTVRDKMHRRMRKHIDIYMGTNRRKALRWGRRRVTIYW